MSNEIKKMDDFPFIHSFALWVKESGGEGGGRKGKDGNTLVSCQKKMDAEDFLYSF